MCRLRTKGWIAEGNGAANPGLARHPSAGWDPGKVKDRFKA